jgi:hypothetical protein
MAIPIEQVNRRTHGASLFIAVGGIAVAALSLVLALSWNVDSAHAPSESHQSPTLPESPLVAIDDRFSSAVRQAPSPVGDPVPLEASEASVPEDRVVVLQQQRIEQLEERVRQLESTIAELAPLAGVTLVGQFRETPEARRLSPSDRELVEHFIKCFGKLPQPWQVEPLATAARESNAGFAQVDAKYRDRDPRDHDTWLVYVAERGVVRNKFKHELERILEPADVLAYLGE